MYLSMKVDMCFLSALQFMHRRGWVHRDLSIANVLLDHNGTGRLVDLEYAKMKDGEDETYLVSLICFFFAHSR